MASPLNIFALNRAEECFATDAPQWCYLLHYRRYKEYRRKKRIPYVSPAYGVGLHSEIMPIETQSQVLVSTHANAVTLWYRKRIDCILAENQQHERASKFDPKYGHV